MDADLKRCPFCGSEPVGSGWNADYFTARVHCGNCEARGPVFDSHQQAIDAWNTRAAPKVKPLEWHELGDQWNTVTCGRIQITQRGVHPNWALSCSSPETDLDYGTLEKAKEAAQKEHERRILSALE